MEEDDNERRGKCGKGRLGSSVSQTAKPKLEPIYRFLALLTCLPSPDLTGF